MRRTYIYDETLGKVVEILPINIDPKIHIIRDIEPYMDENLGQDLVYVRSRRHRTSLLKERGLAIK